MIAQQLDPGWPAWVSGVGVAALLLFVLGLIVTGKLVTKGSQDAIIAALKASHDEVVAGFVREAETRDQIAEKQAVALNNLERSVTSVVSGIDLSNRLVEALLTTAQKQRPTDEQ